MTGNADCGPLETSAVLQEQRCCPGSLLQHFKAVRLLHSLKAKASAVSPASCLRIQLRNVNAVYVSYQFILDSLAD